MIAKNNLIIKDKKRRKLFAKYERKKQILKFMMVNTKSPIGKVIIHNRIQRLPINSTITRIKNYDIITGKGRSVYKKLGLSRHSLRKLSQKGLLLGIKQSSW
jgi:small subunit ribosomal protein S14